MGIQNVKRWQWVLASLVAGLALGYLQRLPTENWQKAFGDTITQRQFEDGLLREQSGQRWFRNIVIYPERVESGGKAIPVYVVAGDYFDGKLETQDGKRIARWQKRCYIAEGPYRAITPIAGSKPTDTVLTYLNRVRGVTHSYAWWRDDTWAIGLWTAASFLMIGVIWPTAINLIAFGSITRPREEPGIDLRHVSSQAAQSASQTSEADMAAVAKMGSELETKLAAEAGQHTPVPDQPAAVAAVRPLTVAGGEAAPTEQTHEQTEFGRDADDFYPTERHKPHAETEHP